MKEICSKCQKVLEDVIYIDFHMTGKPLCERCSIESEIEINVESLKQAEKRIEDYEVDYKPLLGEESEEYQNLIGVAFKAILYYEDRIQELKGKLKGIY